MNSQFGSKTLTSSAGGPDSTPRTVAVIDVGTSSIRMAIAEISSGGGIRILERLIQGVSLGKDSFNEGSIQKPTIEECVRVLRSYRRKLDEYQVTDPSRIRVVATSAVREASNRLAFLDRVYSATGFLIEPIDEAEVSRVTYLGIQPLLKAEPALKSSTTIVAEVGSGSTDVLVLRSDNVDYSHTYRLGSIRLRETLEAYQTPRTSSRRIMETQIDRTIEQVRQHLRDGSNVELLALGSDVRFAASQLLTEWNPASLSRLALAELEAFTDGILELSEDQLVETFHLNLQDAESVGPALLTYARMARAFGLEQILVTDFNLRDALLTEMTVGGEWSEDLRNQILRSAVDFANRFEFDRQHAMHVARLSVELFRELHQEHKLGPRWEMILQVAAILHEIGLFVSTKSYHKHTMYLITNSELFGLGPSDLLRVSLVARYHRRASPKPNHEGYSRLDRDDRVAVSRMAAVLRVADSLDQSRSQRVTRIRCHCEDQRLVITVDGVDDLSVEQLELRQRGPMFEDTYGMQVLLRKGRD